MTLSIEGRISGQVDCTAAQLNAIRTALAAVFGTISKVGTGVWATADGSVEIHVCSLKQIQVTVVDSAVDP